MTVACVPSAAIHFLPSVLGSFTELYPLIRVRVIDEAADQVLASVVSGESDFGISFVGSQVPGVDFEPIHTDAFVLAMRREHRLAGSASLAWSDLGDERLMTAARSSGNRQLLDDAMARAGARPVYRFEVSHMATLLGMVEAGLGVAAVPRLALPESHPTLVGVALHAPAVARVLGLTTRHGASLRAPAKMFHAHLRAVRWWACWSNFCNLWENAMRAISVTTLSSSLAERNPPLLIDVRKQGARQASGMTIGKTICRDPAQWLDWKDEVAAMAGPVVFFCAHGHEIGQAMTAALCAMGKDAAYLEGGFAEWQQAGLKVTSIEKDSGTISVTPDLPPDAAL